MVQLAGTDVQPKSVTLAAPVVEQLPEENVADIMVEKSDTSSEQQIVVEYGRPSVQVPTESRATTIHEELAEERFDEVDHLVAEQTQEQQIQVL